MTTQDLAWAAGFLEGEGSFGWHRTSCIVAAGQVQRWPLERLQQIFGGPIHIKPRVGKQPWYQWRVSGKLAVGIMMTVYMFLSPRRRDQIMASLQEWKSHPPARQFRTHCTMGHPYDEANTIRTKYGRRCRACQPRWQKKYDDKRRLRAV